MTRRLRRAGPGQADSFPWETRTTTSRLRRETPPHLHLLPGGAHPRSLGPERPGGLVAARNPAGGAADTTLAGRVALVVDDEPMILEILAEHCTSLGMEVWEAGDGQGALLQIEAHPGIEVLVTDVRMPGLDGPGLVERALAFRPEIKVIFVTGYTTYSSSTWPILRKPFDLDELEEALRRALAQRGPVPE